MKLGNQPFPLPLVPTVNPQVTGASTPTPPRSEVQPPEPSTAAQGSSLNNGRSTEYPAPSEAELQARDKRGIKFSFSKPPKPPKPPKPSKPSKPSKPPKSSKPSKPSKPSAPPKGPATPSKQGGTKGNLSDSKKLVELNKNNAFPPLSSQLAGSARSALINSAAGSLINIPASVGQHLASQAILDRIQGQAKMPGAEQVDASGAKTTVDPGATDQQKIEARLENSEIKLELMVNSILSINEGPDAPAVGKDPDAPTDTGGRLANLEKSMDAVETQMQDIATRYGLVYDPFIPPTSSESPTDESRTGVVEQRLAYMNKMLRRVIRNAEADAEDAE